MKSYLALLFLTLFIFPAQLLAIDYVYTKANGNKVYKCNNIGTGGKAKIKEVSKGQYMVRGGGFYGKVYADSFKTAAQIACGEIDYPGAPKENKQMR